MDSCPSTVGLPPGCGECVTISWLSEPILVLMPGYNLNSRVQKAAFCDPGMGTSQVALKGPCIVYNAIKIAQSIAVYPVRWPRVTE